MIAKLAFLTSPAPGRYMLNIQTFGSDELIRVEIGKAHLVNILVDGVSSVLREDQYSNCVSLTQTESAHERADDRRQQPA